MRDTKRTRRTYAPRERPETYNEIKRRWQTAVWAEALKRVPSPALVFPVRISFEWHEADQHRDPDGISSGGRKIILDALVQAGVLQKDGWRAICGFGGEEFRSGSGEVGVLVKVVDMGGRIWTLWVPHRLPDYNELHKAEGVGARRLLRRAR